MNGAYTPKNTPHLQQIKNQDQPHQSNSLEAAKKSFFNFVKGHRDTLKKFSLGPVAIKSLFSVALSASTVMSGSQSIASADLSHLATKDSQPIIQNTSTISTKESKIDGIYGKLNLSPESKAVANTIADMGYKEAVDGSTYGTTNPEVAKGMVDDGLKNQAFCHPHVADVLDTLKDLNISTLKHSMKEGWSKIDGKDPNVDPVQFQPFLENEIKEGRANWHRVDLKDIKNPNDLQGMMLIIQPNEETRAEGWTHHQTAGHIVIMKVDDAGGISGYSDGEMNFKLVRLQQNSKNIAIYQLDEKPSIQQQVNNQATSAPTIK